MAIEGVDYSFSVPRAAGLAAAGKKFAMRYIGPGSLSKRLTAGERDVLFAAGLSIVFLVEGAEGDMLRGYDVGRSHAAAAEAQRKALGAPPLPFYFAADKDMVVGNVSALASYMDGAASVIGRDRCGVYGEYDVMGWLHGRGSAVWFFQTYGWSHGKWWPGNHVEQYQNHVTVAGGIVDLCRAVKPQYGQWVKGGVTEGNEEVGIFYATTIEDETLWVIDGGFRYLLGSGIGHKFRDQAYGYPWVGDTPNPKLHARLGRADIISMAPVDITKGLPTGEGGLVDHTHEPGGVAK